jgi:hypothetical protein
MLRAGLILALATFALPLNLSAQETRKPYPRNLITREEIQDRAPDARNAYDVIQRLRPQFLRTRQSGSIQQGAPVAVKVYINGSFRGSVLVLRDLTSHSVVDIAYLNGSDATTRFGTDHENGAIIVRTGA